MALRQALLIIFGANLGTTATGWLVALIGFKLDLDAISLPMIAIGGLCYTAVKHGQIKQYGQLGLGIGLLLLALQFMKSALGEMESSIEPGFLADFELWQYALFGIAASAIMQSSSAVMVLTLSAINSGIIDLPAGAALMIGADLGTTSTVMFGAIGGTANKKRVALGHVIFNLVTDVIAFTFLAPLVALVALLNDPLLSLVAFHSLFNVLGVIIWTPMVTHFARLLERMFTAPTSVMNRFLDATTATVPESAVTALADEVQHLAERVIRQNAAIFDHEIDNVPTKDAYRIGYRETKALEAEILEYALAVEFQDVSVETGSQIDRLLQSGRNLLLSSKLCKDNLNDLRDLADYQNDFFTTLVETESGFYEPLEASSGLIGDLEPDQIDRFIQQNQAGHDRLHDEIYLLIKTDKLPRNKVSTVLNLNRALFNSNLALLTGVALLAQHHQIERHYG